MDEERRQLLSHTEGDGEQDKESLNPGRHGSRSKSNPPPYGSVISRQDVDIVPAHIRTRSDARIRSTLISDGALNSSGSYDSSLLTTASFKRNDPSSNPASERREQGTAAAGRLPDYLVLRARLLSALVLTVYMAASIGSSPLSSQYVRLRLMPEYINMSDNSSVDMNPCTANASDPRVKAETELEARVSKVLLYFSLASTGPMILAAIFLGSYIDVIGRKLLFLLPTVAGLLRMVVVTLIIKLELNLDYFYLINVVDGFSGSFAGLLLATFAYTADLTAPSKSRTLAIAILESCLALAGAGSDIGVGYFIQYVDYFYAALLMVVFYAVSVVLVLFLPETVPKAKDGSAASPSRNPFSYMKHIFGFYFTAGTYRRRAQFLVALVSLALTLLSFLGRTGVEVLYEVNTPFCWGSAKIGVYGGVNVMARAFGSVLSVHFMQRCLSDAAIAASTMLTGAAANVIFGFAKSSGWLYASIPVGAVSNAALPVTRAILSKMAGPSKQGALFASIAVMETICSLASSSMYNTIYSATVAQVRGAVFMVMAGILVVDFLIVLVFMRISAGHSLVSEESYSPPDIQRTARDGYPT